MQGFVGAGLQTDSLVLHNQAGVIPSAARNLHLVAVMQGMFLRPLR